jgi:hypothetical protein
MRVAAFDGHAQGFSRRQQMRLTDELIQTGWAQAIRQGPVIGAFGRFGHGKPGKPG